MAVPTKISRAKAHKAMPLTSHQTALAIVPPYPLRERVDRLRKNYDKAYSGWPAHLNVIYPFVSPGSLPEAVETICSLLAEPWSDSGDSILHLSLGESGYFSHRRSNTVFAAVGVDDQLQRLKALRNRLIVPFEKADELYNPHLTIGQTGVQWQTRDFLLRKISRMLPIKWSVDELVVLVREHERAHTSKESTSRMNVWGIIPLDGSPVRRSNQLTDESLKESGSKTISRENCYHFSSVESTWRELPLEPGDPGKVERATKRFTVSSYNVLLEDYCPPRTDHFDLIRRAILSDNALADAIVLQEVSDEFLSFLLGLDDIRKHYPFTTHGPPDQPGIDPLMSLRNVVVLSRWKFTWDWLPFRERHKGTPVLHFANIGSWQDGRYRPLTLVGVHLSSGLTNEAVSSRQSQVATILSYLSEKAPNHPCIVAGDFNIVTSEHTISLALLQNKSRKVTTENLSAPKVLLWSAGFHDSWEKTQSKDEEPSPEEAYGGEQGATFDPILNPQAARTSGPDLHQRPQRFDRIFVKENDFMTLAGFNLFGFPDRKHSTQLQYASDHWGIRASFSIFPKSAHGEDGDLDAPVPSDNQQGDDTLWDSANVLPHDFCPTEEERQRRDGIFSDLKRTLQAALSDHGGQSEEHPRTPLVVVPVGSYGLDVWTSSSDIDCMCIGSISPSVFFSSIIDKLTEDYEGLRSLRRVDAATGTMLRLDINGIKFDVQYCQAPQFVRIWPEGLKKPPSDSIFDLPMQTLSKLKPLRDLDYLERTIPDMNVYRPIHRFIVMWAKTRGIYSSKFGYLGGFHVAVLLARTLKLHTAHQEGHTSVMDQIRAFFSDYASFDWKNRMVYDPEFHEQPPNYRREEREPLVILGPHVPRINVARTASVASVRTLEEEFKQADQLLSKRGANLGEIMSQPTGEASKIRPSTQVSAFLTSYPTYIRLDVQYWGNDCSAAGSLIGWLESRCVHLIVDITRKLPMLHSRIWPSRFSSTFASTHQGVDGNDNDSQHQTSYLIGVRKLALAPTGDVDRKVAHNKLLTVIRSFVENTRADSKYFDSTSAWIDAKLVKQSAIRSMVQEEGDWEDVIRHTTTSPVDIA